MARKKYDPLYNDYVQAKKKAWEESHIRLSEGDFLRSIDPEPKWSDARATYYMQQLKSGEWSSVNVMRRTKSPSGMALRTLFRNRRGEIVSSANVRLPGGYSLHQAYMDGSLQKAAERYRERESPLREKDEDEEDEDDLIVAGVILVPKGPKNRKIEFINNPRKPLRRNYTR